jgi:hypothetical protein
MKAWSLRLVLSAAVILSATLLSGCPQLSFQFLFQNDGDYPVIGLYIEPDFVPANAVNLLTEPVPPYTDVVIDRIFARGLDYAVIVVFDVDGVDEEVVPPIVDTSSLGEAWITLHAHIRQNGSYGGGYSYGLPYEGP